MPSTQKQRAESNERARLPLKESHKRSRASKQSHPFKLPFYDPRFSVFKQKLSLSFLLAHITRASVISAVATDACGFRTEHASPHARYFFMSRSDRPAASGHKHVDALSLLKT
ncbi:unnamed protein product [Caenorhabditis auriculariae]|uniref:Uncharacterized protein n=1 Tax=Caenorhabditis auriculariae TaxID=2777116 RepID=A0A8S1GRW2_9PELO|nr:unnamed protein product [Caenorhabditis auriculariae]